MGSRVAESAAEREIYAILAAAGAELVRRRKHQIYRLPDGRVWTVPSSPSCHRWAENNLHELRKMVGPLPILPKPDAGKPRERKLRKPGRTAADKLNIGVAAEVRRLTMAEQLQASGAVEMALRLDIQDRDDVIDSLTEKLDNMLSEHQKPCTGCWWCRLRARRAS